MPGLIPNQRINLEKEAYHQFTESLSSFGNHLMNNYAIS